MSDTIRGTVTKVYEKNGFFSLIIDDTFYGFGKRKPNANAGDFVTFSADRNGKYWNADGKTLVIAGGSDKPAAPAPRSSGGLSKDDYWTNRELRDIETQKKIQWQSARNSAIEFVKLALDKEAIKLPTKAADKADALVEFVNHYASIFNDITDKGLKKEVKDDNYHAADTEVEDEGGDDYE